MPDLSDTDIDAIAQRTAHHMSAEYKQLWIDRETHYHDHLWIGAERQHRDEVAQFRRKVLASVTIWAAIAVVGFVAVASWREIGRALREIGG